MKTKYQIGHHIFISKANVIPPYIATCYVIPYVKKRKYIYIKANPIN
jgi:hypothetical protein